MSVIDRIKSIAKKLNYKIEGETIVELLDSLETAIDGRIDTPVKPVAPAEEKRTVMSELRETFTPKPKNNKRTHKNDDE